MSQLEIWLLALALAMDCFTVAITSGIIQRRWHGRTALSISLSFGLFQGLMPIVGWMCTRYLHGVIESFDHWIAFGLLLFLGGRMVVEGLKGEESEHHFDPSDLKTVLLLGIAVSIDALAVGISFACVGLASWEQLTWPVLVITLVSCVLALLGYVLGLLFGRKLKLPAEPIGGMILIAIGCRILYEHLMV